MYCACATSCFILIGRILSLMCRLGTGKVSFFSVLIAPSCGVNIFVQEELFKFDNYYFMGNLRQKSRSGRGACRSFRV